MMIRMFIYAGLPLAALSLSGHAESIAERLADTLASLNPELAIEHIEETPIPSIREVKLSTGEYIYASEDGRYLLSGPLMEAADGQIIDLTEARLEQDRSQALAKLDLTKAITFSPAGAARAEVFVFTDISCGYCQRFHSHVPDVTAAGVTVHYLAYPRAGMTSPVAETMSRAWCSQNQQAAITEALKENRVSQPALPCKAPVAEHLALGRQVGVRGTPAIFDTSGRSLGGYLTTEQLLAALAE